MSRCDLGHLFVITCCHFLIVDVAEICISDAEQLDLCVIEIVLAKRTRQSEVHKKKKKRPTTVPHTACLRTHTRNMLLKPQFYVHGPPPPP